MQRGRRHFLKVQGKALLSVAAASGVASPLNHLMAEAKSNKAKPKSPRRRLLFNWDGSMIHCYGKTVIADAKGPLTRQQFVSLVFAPIENSGVDTVMFSFGSGNVAEYQSNILEWPGQADEFQFPKSKTWHGGIEVDPKDQYLNPKSLADAGHNPPAVVVEECHKRSLGAFVSLRMNDCHDGLHGKEALPNPELPTFKRQNADWLVEDLDRWTALDFRRPQVRALKLRVIEEFFDRWDFDGIELDWLRHTLNFPRGTERENSKFLTEFMHAVRKSLKSRAEKRGRPIEIAVRIPERLEWALEGGYDAPTWIKEDLVDILILGQGLTELPTLKEFRSLMKERQLPIYPCVFPYGNGYQVSPDEVVRANAANLYRDGSDGLYLFNWFNYGNWRKPLLSDIANPGLLANKDKHYTLVHRFDAGRNNGTDYLRFNTPYKDAHVPFEINVADGQKTVLIPLANLPKRAELWVALEYSQPKDVLTLTLNGRDLIPAEVAVEGRWQTLGYQVHLPPGNGTLGLPASAKVDLQFSGLRWPVPADLLKTGQNKLTIQLNKRGTGAEKPLQVSRLELWASEAKNPA